MKPETRIALVKMSERTKHVQASEYPRGWAKWEFIGALGSSAAGLLFLTSAIQYVAQNGPPLVGALYLLVTLAFTFAPWYFLIRYKTNKNLQLLSDAILSLRDNVDGRGSL